MATAREGFHLRPTATAASVGAELPAGTVLELLAPQMEFRRRGTTLFRVRVRDGGALGFTFVVPSTLSGGCPVVWPDAPPTNGAAVVGDDPNDERFVRPGVATTRDGALAADLAPTQIHSLGHLDVDGDGTPDDVLRITVDEGASTGNVVVRHTSAGFVSVFLGVDADSSLTGSEMSAPVQADGAAYLVFESSSVSNEDSIDDHGFGLCRFRGTTCVSVFLGQAAFGTSEEWTFSPAGTGDGSLRVTSSRTGSQVLRWDPQSFRLVAMP